MNLLSWNCRGLGGLRAVHEVTKMVTKYKPQVIFLIETKKKSHEMEWLRSRWKFDRCFLVDGIGRGGGLAMLWMEDAQVVIQSYSKYHIDVSLGQIGNGTAWRLTGFYGDPKTIKRRDSWQMLRKLKNSSQLPWMCIGDFNEILSDSEKLGGALRPQTQMSEFRKVLEDCELTEISSVGGKFTWTRGKVPMLS